MASLCARACLGTFVFGFALLGNASEAQAQPCEAEEFCKLVASDGAAGDQFGGMSATWAVDSVAISDRLIVVGTPFDDEAGDESGSAYVYRFDGNAWTEELRLNASDAAAGDRFGVSVSARGNLAVVGAPYDDDCGAVYVFRFDEPSWSQEAKLVAGDAAGGDSFGMSVSVGADLLAVGAPGDDAGGEDCGSVYVFAFDGGAWVEQAKLVVPCNPEMGRFGSSVSVDSDAVLGGAPAGYDGAAHVFRFDGGTWLHEATLTPSVELSMRFGSSVSLSGDVAAIGACNVPEWGPDTVCIYRYADGAWNEEASLSAGDATEWIRFGRSVAIDGDVLVVGADLSNDAGEYAGSAYVYRRVEEEWREEAKLRASDADAGNLFGHSVSLSSSVAVIAAPSDDDAGDRSGSAYVFDCRSDCNSNGRLDSCDIADGTSEDCNENGVPDECDIADGTSADADANGVPDDCITNGDDDGRPSSDQAGNETSSDDDDTAETLPSCCGVDACGAGLLGWLLASVLGLSCIKSRLAVRLVRVQPRFLR